MLRKHSILFGFLTSMVLLFVATLFYPGGSQDDQNSLGFNWQHNYLSNLFGDKAVNSLDNASQPWAIAGMLFLAVSAALFFLEFSRKIPKKGAAKIVKYAGAGAGVCAFLSVTPYHDTMLTIGGTLALVAMFYITVFVFKSKLHLFKILSVVCLVVAYACNFIYYTRTYLELLPIMQKIGLAITIIWVLGLVYFTKKEDFQQLKVAEADTREEG